MFVVIDKTGEFFNFLLKTSVSVSLLRTSNRLFHILGPCTLKEHSAKVFHLTKGTTNRLVCNADLRPGLLALQTTNRF